MVKNHNQKGVVLREKGESPRPYVFAIAAFAALNSVNLGYDMGVNSSVGYHLQGREGGMRLSDLELEMFFGIFGWAAVIGALSAYSVSDWLGRRRAFGVSAVGFICGVLWTALAPNYVNLMLGRMITGVGVGFGLAIDPVYISEVSPPQFRGQLVTWSETATNSGILLGFIVGAIVQKIRSDVAWRLMLGVGAILPTILIILVCTVMPESPRWLVAQGREEEAMAVFSRCYSPGFDTEQLIDAIKGSLLEEKATSETITWRMLLCYPTPAMRRMLVVGIGVAICQQTTAIEAVQYYLIYILESSGIQSRSQQFTYLIVLGAIKLFVIVLAGRLFDHPRLGRRPLLLASNIGIFCSLVTLAVNLSWDKPSAPLAVISLGVFMMFFSLGMGPGCWLVASEVFSLNIRARAMSLATFSNRFLSATISATFLSLRKLLSDTGFFLVFALLVVGNIYFIAFHVPETKGRTLEDMLQYFENLPPTAGWTQVLFKRWTHRYDRQRSASTEEVQNPIGKTHHYGEVLDDLELESLQLQPVLG